MKCETHFSRIMRSITNLSPKMNFSECPQLHLWLTFKRWSEFSVLENEPEHIISFNVTRTPSEKTLISQSIRTVWPESSLDARRCVGSLATHRRPCKESDQSTRMLIWVFAGRTCNLAGNAVFRFWCFYMGDEWIPITLLWWNVYNNGSYCERKMVLP